MKKAFLFFALGLVLTMSASEQSKTNASTLSTKIAIAPNAGDNPVILSIVETTQNVFVTAEIANYGYCLSKTSQIDFVLDDGKEVSQFHINTDYCEVSAKLSIRLTPESLKHLSESPISSMRFKTDTGTHNLKDILDKDFFVRNFKHKNYKFG